MVQCRWCGEDKEKLEIIRIDKESNAICSECAEKFNAGTCRKCGKTSKFLEQGLCTDCAQVEMLLQSEIEETAADIEMIEQCDQRAKQPMSREEVRSFLLPVAMSEEDSTFLRVSQDMRKAGFKEEAIDNNKDSIVKMAIQYKEELRNKKATIIIKRNPSDIRGKSVIDCDGDIFILEI